MTLYPWGGEFKVGNSGSPVGIVHMAEKISVDMDMVAISGPLKTENLGIEKIVANIISNPNIRFLIMFGKDIRGHRAGDTLINLYTNGIDNDNRVVGAKGAVPYIENIGTDAIERFQQQVELIDLIGIIDRAKLDEAIMKSHQENPGCFGEPFIVIAEEIERKAAAVQGSIALHAKLVMDEYGRVKKPQDSIPAQEV